MEQERGRNVLEEEKRRSAVMIFLEQLNDPLIYILLAAAVISAFLREFGDVAIILAVVLLNGTVGAIQEGKAQKALDSLRQMTSPRAWIREGEQIKEVDASWLEPGDVVCLEAGRQVPADLKLIHTVQLKIEESALTGESVPVTKDAEKKNRAYMGTNVLYGKGEGVVTAIGMETEIGKIASMLKSSPRQMTPLQKRLEKLGNTLGILSVFLCVLLFAAAMLQKRDPVQMLLTAISLAVAAVPEGLPAIVTIVLALSVSRMVKVHAIVRRLPSVETLGCVNVVCSDKTGTMTQNRMKAVRCYAGGTVSSPRAGGSCGLPADYLSGFALCNDAVSDGTVKKGDPTELALLELASVCGTDQKELVKRMPRVGEIPFDSARKRMTTIHRTESGTVSYTKGSPEEILKGCRFTETSREEEKRLLGQEDRKRIDAVLASFAEDGLRILALAKKEGEGKEREKDMTFLGLAGIADPIRPEAKKAVRDFGEAGIKTVMITGDRMDTALAAAKELGIAKSGSECMSGEELDQLTDPCLLKQLPRIRVFAHVSPEHKVRIVEGYQRLGETVAMTGDGVNDAPSLRRADVGIAMGKSGTDVAKNAADIILTDDNFATIAKAVEQGRCIYENIRKAVLFLLSSNFGEIVTMLAAVLCGFASPLKSGHILWINLITDSLPALALGTDPVEEGRFAKEAPRSGTESLFAGGGLCCTVFYGLLIALISMAAFLRLPVQSLREAGTAVTPDALRAALEDPALLAGSQTYAFTVLGMSQLFHAVGMRDAERSVFAVNQLENRLMIAAAAAGFGLQLLVTRVPFFISLFGTVCLSAGEWISLLLLSAMPVAAHECLIVFSRRTNKEKITDI